MANLPPSPEFIKSLEPNSPIDSNFVYGADDWLRFVQQVLENQFPTSEDDSANGWDIALTVKASEVNALEGITGPVEQRLSIMEGLSPALVYLDVAPTGWTIVAAVDEHSVRLTKGSVATGETGGTSGGTNDFSTQFVDSPEGGLVGDHTLTGAESGTSIHAHGQDNNAHGILTSWTGGQGQVHGTIQGGSQTGTGNTPVYTTSISGERVIVVGDTDNSSAASADDAHGHSVDLAVKWAACIMIALD